MYESIYQVGDVGIRLVSNVDLRPSKYFKEANEYSATLTLMNGERPSNVIIEGIETGFAKVKPISDGYSIYGADYTAIFESWINLSKKDKEKQILALFEVTDKLSEAEKGVKTATDKVSVLEESL